MVFNGKIISILMIWMLLIRFISLGMKTFLSCIQHNRHIEWTARAPLYFSHLKGLSPSFKSSNFTQVGRSRAPATAGRGIHGPPDPLRGRRRGRHRGRRRGRRRPPVMYRGGKRLDGGVLPWKIHDKWFYSWENVRTWSRHGEFSSGSWPCLIWDSHIFTIFERYKVVPPSDVC